jgi:hypothetical protein
MSKSKTLTDVARERGVSRQEISRRVLRAGKSSDAYQQLAEERAALAAAQRRKIEREERVRRGDLVELADVEAGHAEMREVIRSDLIGALPLRLANELSGRAAMQPHEVRATVLAAVRDMIRGWAQADIPTPGV